MPRSVADLESIHRLSMRNRALLAHSDTAGCFYCGALFPAIEITDWIDGRQVETGATADGETALCPRCGIDAVLPSTVVGHEGNGRSIELAGSLLAEMREHFF